MSDFAQAGSICTLQRLVPDEASLPALEASLLEQSRTQPIALILPCRGDDLSSAALESILRELEAAVWLDEILLVVNGPGSVPDLPRNVRILRTDSMNARGALSKLLDLPLADLPEGKGVNVWAGTGVLAGGKLTALMATQDADVASFRRGSLARLCAPCVHPRLGFSFAKMYYSRVTDRLYGRVSRLFFAPLLQALLRVTGHLPLLDFLLAFRYPLAGECALRVELATELPFSAGYGLEAGLLCEVFRQVEPSAVCQVDGGSGYDHRHHPGLPHSPALPAMCGEIARALLGQLEREGVTVDEDFRAALQSAYGKESALALRRSEALALMNGLPFHAGEEAEMVQAFTLALAPAAESSGPTLPPWSRLFRERPAEAAAFLEAIGTADFTSR